MALVSSLTDRVTTREGLAFAFEFQSRTGTTVAVRESTTVRVGAPLATPTEGVWVAEGLAVRLGVTGFVPGLAPAAADTIHVRQAGSVVQQPWWTE